jgi:hypothetical protein
MRTNGNLGRGAGLLCALLAAAVAAGLGVAGTIASDSAGGAGAHTPATVSAAGPSAHTPAMVSAATGGKAECRYRAFPDGAIVPDPACTPGALNPAAVADPRHTICTPGYAGRMRPPVSYTEPLKVTEMVEYDSPGPPSAYEEDHLVAIEDGGSSRDPRNLWPEYLYGPGGALEKDQAEDRVHELICAGRITVAQGARLLEGDWKRLLAGG